MADELPVLVASVGFDQARELEEASRVGRHVWVDLKWPPGEPGPHLLEVYIPSQREPLRLLAEPLGSRSEKGFALRIYPWDEGDGEVMQESFLADVEIVTDRFAGRSLAGGRLEMLAPLGEGSIGVVYRARHTGLGIVVAVKVLHEAFQRDAAFSRRFYDEALALSRLDHPNLVHIYDFGQEPDGLLYLSMALVEGRTLRAIFAEEKRTFETKRMVAIMLQLAAGLGHAHGRGLIHRDVKPDNVMIATREDDDGVAAETVKVLDFGFAIPPSASVDVAQRLAGTPVYMSPEQCLGEELDARCDVYACGCMIFELMTGTVPFLGRSADEIRDKQVHAPPPFIAATRSNVDPRLDRLVQRALAKSRDDRHPNMQELRADLKSLLIADGAPLPRQPARSVPSFPSLSTPAREMPSQRAIPAAAASREAPSIPPPTATTDALARDPAGWLMAMTRERDPEAFTRRFAELEGGVRVLAERGEVRAIRLIAAVVASMEDRLSQLTASDAGARAVIENLSRLLKDPDLLAILAGRMLVGTDDDAKRAATELLRAASVSGAYALYGARARHAVAEPTARVVFVTTMKTLGEPALPVVLAGLEKIFQPAFGGATRSVIELAEDLLLSIPATRDETAGHLVLKYAASPVPVLCRAAARALPRVWGERAAPALVTLVRHPEDGVRVAAIVGLREVDAVDEAAVRAIASLFDGAEERSAQLKSASMAALKSAHERAQIAAFALMARIA